MPKGPKVGANRRPLRDRLLDLCSPEPMSGCWIWAGMLNKKGYGTIMVSPATSTDRKVCLAHRLAYVEFKGAIPLGLVLDHLCRNTACINPDHLEAVTSRTNVLRGVGITARNASKTHCPKGHPFSGENLYVTPEGFRHCRICSRASTRDWRERIGYLSATSLAALARRNKNQ